jgi:hypothetical protein
MTVGGLIAILAALMISFGPVGRLHDMPQNVETTESRLDALNPPEKKEERTEVAAPQVSMTRTEKGVGRVGGGGFLSRLRTRLEFARRGIPTKPQGYASCRRCGLPIVRATRFCQSCGADFGRMVCSCGRELGSGNRFCDRCGRKV